jgi:pyruvate,water dikinase
MTVRVAGGTETQPVPAVRRRAPVFTDRAAAELTRLGVRIEELFATPVDVEWTLADGTFAIVQARPITALPPEPVRWAPPIPGVWLRGGGIMEFITEPVSPFMETFVTPLFEQTVYELAEQFGIADLFTWPMGCFVNGYIYGRLDMHLRPHHALGFIRSFRAHMQSVDRWPAALQQYRSSVAALCRPKPTMLTARELNERMEALILAGGRYWNHIGMIIRVIIDREGRFTKFYNRSIRRSGDPGPEIFLRGQENRPLEAERSVYVLAQAARALPGVADILTATDRDVIKALADTAPGREFRQRLKIHLDQFGYQIASLDPLWPALDDDPRPVLKAVQGYLAGQESPQVRQRRMMKEQTAALDAIASRLISQQRRKFRALLSDAQEMARLREDAMFELGLAWRPLYQCALELGRRMVATDALAAAEEIFWLTRAELQMAITHLDANRKLKPFQDTVCARQDLWRRRQSLQPPPLLPVGSKPKFWWKYVFPVPEMEQQPDATMITGPGVSPGKITAVARVITSPGAMDRLNKGEVLVTHLTTPAWTPLFAYAAALVTDLGGPLSHGSIVAREYGIPAVMGTGLATRRIRDGQVVTVDGAAGRVYLQNADAQRIGDVAISKIQTP